MPEKKKQKKQTLIGMSYLSERTAALLFCTDDWQTFLICETLVPGKPTTDQ